MNPKRPNLPSLSGVHLCKLEDVKRRAEGPCFSQLFATLFQENCRLEEGNRFTVHI
jgi:hypothetical protein